MNVPKLRFKEFNDEWIEGNFSKTFSFISNNSLSRNDLNYNNQTNIFNIHYGDILTKMNNIVDVSNFAFPSINTQYLEKYNKKDNFLCNGDIVIADTAEDYTAGKSIELQCINNEKIISGLHTIPLRPIIEFSKNYLGYYLNSSYFHNQLIPLITGIKVMSITKSNLENTYIRYPSKNEQEKIGTFLGLLDKKIELQSKKIKALKLYKKGLDIKIFNTKTSFYKDKFKNCFDSIGGTSLEEYVCNNGTHKIISIGNYSPDGTYIDNGQRINLNNKTKTKLLNKNDLVMILNDKTTTGDIIGSCILIDEDNKYIYNQRSQRIICKKNVDPIYAWCFLNSRIFRNKIFKKSQGGTQIYVNFSVVENEEIYLPVSKNISTIITKSIILLMKEIKLEEEKLSKLESLKKGLMQNMFV